MHLKRNGFNSGYIVWTSHAEVENETVFNNFAIDESKL